MARTGTTGARRQPAEPVEPAVPPPAEPVAPAEEEEGDDEPVEMTVFPDEIREDVEKLLAVGIFSFVLSGPYPLPLRR